MLLRETLTKELWLWHKCDLIHSLIKSYFKAPLIMAQVHIINHLITPNIPIITHNFLMCSSATRQTSSVVVLQKNKLK